MGNKSNFETYCVVRGKVHLPCLKWVFISVISLLMAVLVSASQAADIDLSGQIRLRPEYRDNADFNDSTSDTSSFVGSRIRFTIGARATEDVSAKITFQDTRNWGEDNVLTDKGGEAVDIHEGYLQMKDVLGTRFTLRAGRQEIKYGDERLVGAFGWSNNGRAFDAFKLIYSDDALNIDAWAAKIQENNVSAGNSDNDKDFYGIYATVKNIVSNTLDLYLLLDRDSATHTLPAKPKAVYTLGARLAGKLPDFGVDYTFEFPYQFGDNGTRNGSGQDVDVQAYAFGANIGYTIPGDSGLRVGFEYDYATGDNNSGDDKAETFNNLYPTNHGHYGSMDQQSWRNMSAWNLNIKAKVAPKVSIYAAYWLFSLAEKEDGWYTAGGTATGFRAANSANSEDTVGSEIDLEVKYKYNKKTIVKAGYGHLFTGNYIETNVANEADQDWAYLMLIVNL